MNPRTPIARFVKDKSGQFTIIASILALPLLAGVGLAVDYSSISNAKTRLRDSNDAAALFAATQYRQKGALPEQSVVEKMLVQDFEKSGSEGEPTIKRMELVDGKLFLESQVDKKMFVMGIFGHKQIEIPGNSVVNVGSDEQIEIALALDTTHSMLAPSGSSSNDLDPAGDYFKTPISNVTRLDALKFSATQFANTVFKNDNGSGKTRVAIVPFADYVNVGVDKRGQPWLQVDDDKAATGKSCSMQKTVIGSENCREVMVTIDGVQFPTTQCDPIYGPEQEVCYPTGSSAWYGCVGSRNEPLNLKDASPGTKFTGIHNIWCAMPLQTLSGDQNAVLTTIANLTPYGNTYIPEGVMWGMRTLSSLEPFTDVKVPSGIKKVRKIMVLMTDGDNQAAADIPTAPTHHGLWESQPNYAEERKRTDDWTLDACGEAKKAGIELYTISFGVDISATARGIVNSCATDSSYYFDAKNAESLNEAFQAIAAKIGGLYLAG